MKCSVCGAGDIVGVEYAYNDPAYYDGVSEWRCVSCGSRVGRWSKRVLKGDECEWPYGQVRDGAA